MIKIDGQLISPMHIITAYVESVHYFNGSRNTLVVKLSGGTTIRKEHGYGFDAWKELDKIAEAGVPCPTGRFQ